MTSYLPVSPSKTAWRPTKSFWITVAVWLVLLIGAVSTGEFGSWLVVAALFLIGTAVYAFVKDRPTWLGIPDRKRAAGAGGAGVVAVVAGLIVTGLSAPAPSDIAPLADLPMSSTTEAAPSPVNTLRYVLLDECFDSGEFVAEGTETYRCTANDSDELVWMTAQDAETLLAARIEATRKAEEKVAAEKVAAEKNDAEKVAAEKAAVEKAAADEVARIAAEQAAQQPAPQIQPLVEVPAAAYYPNCAAAKAAGAAPMYEGQPGYRAALDRDKEGIACDK